MHRDQHNHSEHLPVRDTSEKKPDTAPNLEKEGATVKRGRKKDLTPEQAGELQARQRAIGQELRRIYDAVAHEPVPPELLDLVRQIDRKRDN